MFSTQGVLNELLDPAHTEKMDVGGPSLRRAGGIHGDGDCGHGVRDCANHLAGRSRGRPTVDRGLMALLVGVLTMPCGILSALVVSTVLGHRGIVLDHRSHARHRLR